MGGWLDVHGSMFFFLHCTVCIFEFGFPLSSRCQNLFVTLATFFIFLLLSHWISRPFLFLMRHPYQPLYWPSLTFAFGTGCLQSPQDSACNHLEETRNHACYLAISSLGMVGKTLLLMGPKLMLGTADLCVCASHSLMHSAALAEWKVLQSAWCPLTVS